MSGYGQYGMTVTPAGTWEPYRLDSGRGYGESLMPGENSVIDMDKYMDPPVIIDIGPNATNMQRQYGTEDAEDAAPSISKAKVNPPKATSTVALVLAASAIGAATGAAATRKKRGQHAAIGAAVGAPIGLGIALLTKRKKKDMGRFGEQVFATEESKNKLPPSGTSQTSWWAKVPWPVKLTMAFAAPVAIGISYAKNHSIGLAIVHGIFATPYIVYRLASGDIGKRRRSKR